MHAVYLKNWEIVLIVVTLGAFLFIAIIGIILLAKYNEAEPDNNTANEREPDNSTADEAEQSNRNRLHVNTVCTPEATTHEGWLYIMHVCMYSYVL